MSNSADFRNVKIKRLELKNLGPFSDAELYLRPDFTVITGANDVGKSILLRLVEAVTRGRIHDSLINLAAQIGEESAGLKVEYLEGEISEHHEILPKSNESAGIPMTCIRVENTEKVPDTIIITEGQTSYGALSPLMKLVTRDLPMFNGGKVLEKKWKSLSPRIKEQYIDSINRKLREIADRHSNVVRWTLKLDRSPTRFLDRGAVGVRVYDQDRGGVPTKPSERGAGFHAVMSVAPRIVESDADLVLVDEPERSLHPLAQKQFRDFLLDIGGATSADGPQIVVVTHSPFFVDTTRPSSVRVVRSTPDDGSIVVNSPDSTAHKTLRQELGLAITDTLVFAQVVVLVEGKTEQRNLPGLLRKMHAEDLDIPVDNIAFQSCEGMSEAKVAAILRTLGVPTCAILDGDHNGDMVKASLKAQLDEELIVQWECEEIEGIVAEEVLIRVTEQLSGSEQGSFESWRDQSDKKVDRWPLSSQIQKFFTDTLDETPPSKALILEMALDDDPTLAPVGIDGLAELKDATNGAWQLRSG